MRRRHLIVLPVAVLLLAAAASPRAPLTLGDLPPVTDEMLEESVSVGDPDSFGYAVTEYAGRLRVDPLATEETDGEETVVTLASDILFAVDDATLSDAARAELGGLVSDLPDGADVAVDGHTDSVGSDDHNQALSERRATAVADALRAARPDLHLTVTGLGETQPAVEEAGDDIADDRAANRRVELRHVSVERARATPAPTPEPVRSTPPRTGTTPQALPLPGDVVSTHDVRFPAVDPRGTEVVVGVEEVVVRGAVTHVSLLVRLEGDLPDDPDDIPWLYEAIGDEVAWDPALIDREGLLRYGELRVQRLAYEWAGEGGPIGTELVVPRRFTISFPRLLGDPGTVDIALGSGLPTITGVDVEVQE